MQQAPGSSLRYISVPHAVLLGSVVSRSATADGAACAAACAVHPAAAAFNYCPADAPSGCQMDAALAAEPPGSCHCLAQTAIQTPSLLPLLGSGRAIRTTAGAPLAPELSDLPEVDGYPALPAYSLFDIGNTVRGGRAGQGLDAPQSWSQGGCPLSFRRRPRPPINARRLAPAPPLQLDCPESFQSGFCALAIEVPELAAACNATPGCTTINMLLGASLARRAGGGSSIPSGPVGVLKALSGSVTPHQLCYAPSSALYLQGGLQVELPPGQQAASAAPVERSASSAGGTSSAGALLADAEAGREDAECSLLTRPQAELRPVGGGEPGTEPRPNVCAAALPALACHAAPAACVAHRESCCLSRTLATCSHAPLTQPGWAIVAPNVLLPGAPMTGTTIEPSVSACLQRCTAYPGCHSESHRIRGSARAGSCRQRRRHSRFRPSIASRVICASHRRRHLLPSRRQRFLRYWGEWSCDAVDHAAAL